MSTCASNEGLLTASTPRSPQTLGIYYLAVWFYQSRTFTCEHLQALLDSQFEEFDCHRQQKRNAIDTGLNQFISCMKMISRYEYGVRNYFKNKKTKAGSEGINTKKNIIKRRAYG
jgi:transposase